MEELKSILTALLGGDESLAAAVLDRAAADGVATVADAAELTEADWIGYGVKKVPAKKLVKKLTVAAAPAPEPAAASTAASPFTAVSLLPVVPDDEAFLKLLQVGGKLKMAETDVMSAVRVCFAQRYGLFEIEDRLMAAIGARAEENDEAYPELYWQLERSLSRRAHADVLKALDISARVVSERNKKQFLGRISVIWALLAGFQDRMQAWQSSLQATMGNPALIGQAMLAAMSGDRSMMAASGMMTPPDPAPLVDAATSVIDALNKMFAGPGIPVARALAADAIQLKDILSKPELVAAVGCATHDEMIRKLGLSVTADAVRTERAVTQYVLGVLKLPEITPDQATTYIVALMQLGALIPWSTLADGGTCEAEAGSHRPGRAGRQPY